MINYKILHDSIEHYKTKGFTRIESPWMVSEYVDNITKPKDVNSFKIEYNQKCLVASGEQSFLYLYLKDFLPLGKFQTITPCFRNEAFDSLHSNSFMKNELIVTDDVNDAELTRIVTSALDFFRQYIPEAYIKPTKIGYDIEIGGNELGSYGIRGCDYLTWIYGTGCAEPRLSNLMKRYGISQQ